MTTNKKIITINALYNLYEDNPDLSFRQCTFMLFDGAKSKRLDIGFKKSSRKVFYNTIINYIKKNGLFCPPKQRPTNELKEIYFEID
jgi:hypothetical protein